MNEIWKDINKYNGNYQISNFGRVKSLQRTIIDSMGRKFNYYEKILFLSINQFGYCRVRFSKNSKQVSKLVHRLVAEHFISNPYNYPVVNHKDGNKLNNNIENLEWTTHSLNQKHAYEKGFNPSTKRCYR